LGHKAAELGNANAKASIYSLAQKNFHEALKTLVNDAENGSALAQSTLLLLLGLGVPQANHESVKWYRFAAERAISKAKINIVNFNKKNIPQALKALQNDAENGDAKAQFHLSIMLGFGLGVPKDEKEAAKWYKLAVKNRVALEKKVLGKH
jgi:uncharacterized protein